MCEPLEILPVLGIYWKPVEDVLSIGKYPSPEKKSGRNITKMIMLSVTQRVFDPVGFTCPTISPKLLLHKTW